MSPPNFLFSPFVGTPTGGHFYVILARTNVINRKSSWRNQTFFIFHGFGTIFATPYSMNRLFSEFSKKFGGAFLEVCETISGGIWQVLRGSIKETYPDTNKKKI